MSEIEQAFDMVLGSEFVDEMIRRLLIIGTITLAIIVLVMVLVIWRLVACGKIKKAMIQVSNNPNEENIRSAYIRIKKISILGKKFAKLGIRYNGLSRTECMNIFNNNIYSSNISELERENFRKVLISIGCNGLKQ